MANLIHRAITSTLLILFVQATAVAQTDRLQGHIEFARRLTELGLREGHAYDLLRELTSAAPHRLSGSEGAEEAVRITHDMMVRLGFDKVWREKVMVPRWVRGPVEEAAVVAGGGRAEVPLNVCALGSSIATPEEGVTAEVIEVKTFDELRSLGKQAQGKIVFFNRAMDPGKLNTFEAYGGAVDQRSRGAVEAAKAGGVAALVRSMTTADDDVPHTGNMNYAADVPRIPAAALGIKSANLLSDLLRKGERVSVRLRLTCQTLPDVESANVVGQITGSEYPDEIIVVSGHLDGWDKGEGAHDDAGGCVQAIEAIRLLKHAGIKPKRTIRAVMFMNEENGVRGGRAYPVAPERQGERHIAAIESDRGSFAPRGFTIDADSATIARVQRWKPVFDELLAGRLVPGGSGVDIDPLVKTGVPGFGLDVERHRYFDYHHSANDTLDKVHPRELQMGAIVEAMLCYLISEEGL
jgi:carboxypeptidase Q